MVAPRDFRNDRHYTDAALTVPNVLTGLRIVLAAAAATLFWAARAEELAVVMCVAAVALDAFDGWYARTFSQCSSLGEHLDPFADKLLMAVVYGVLAIRMDSAIVWYLITLVAIREIGMTIFRSYSLRRHRQFIPANSLGKAKMIVQSTVGLAFVTYGVFVERGFDLPVVVVAVPLAAILVLSYVSAGVYVGAWRSARQPGRRATAAGDSKRMVVGE
jgi:CDP-diacylglycerol--glycerol-3-phosphate 3-phosphatidyltransferase